MTRFWHGVAGVVVCVGFLCVGVGSWAHETDQFLMPEEGEFADLGPHFNKQFVAAIVDGVAEVNRGIDAELSSTTPNEDKLARLRSPEHIAAEVRRQLPSAMVLIEGLEWNLPRASFREAYGDKITIYKVHFKDGMHSGLHAPYDPRIIGRLWRSGTIRIYDTYLGTDKLGHFVDMGYRYYVPYRRAIRDGKNEEKAMAIAVSMGTRNFFTAESGLLGTMSSGAYSNADLASNYVGCLYFRNLTESIVLNDELREPTTFVNEAGRMEVAAFVTEDPDFFKRYVCDHYNEALNPSLFQRGMRKRARKAVAERRDHLMSTWYAGPDGKPRPDAYFTEKVAKLATYGGMDYGHSFRFKQLVHFGNTAPGNEDHLDD